MTPEQIERVFGRGRLRMVTGELVEVFREATPAGERRRYTKRFLNTVDADFGKWTEREWRILARLIGHGIDCVPEVVQFDRGAPGGTQLVQTYDAGVTVDQWATLLPVARESRVLRHVFEDCAHWWALAHHCLRALLSIHELSVVHLDIKGDNVCIPVGPAGFDPHGADPHLHPRFAELGLIDFAFALVSGESLTTALPIGWQTDYDYQSPRLLSALEAGRRGNLTPTRELDWRCDMYSLAAMLKRYLPHEDAALESSLGWSLSRIDAAKALILALREAHDRETALHRPHQDLMRLTGLHLAEADLAASLASGWALARDVNVTPVATSPLTPLTRLAAPIRVFVSPRERLTIGVPPTVIRRRTPPAPLPPPVPGAQAAPRTRSRMARVAVLATLAVIGVAGLATPMLDSRWPAVGDAVRGAVERVRLAANAHPTPPAKPGASEDVPGAEAAGPPEVAAAAARAQAAAATGSEVPAAMQPDKHAATGPDAPAVNRPEASAVAASRPAPATPSDVRAAAPATTPTTRGTKLARSTTTPAMRATTEATGKAAQSAARRAPPPAVATKAGTVRLASASGATPQARIRFHVPDAVASASASAPAQIAVIAAQDPVPAPVRPVPERPRAEASVAETPVAPPPQARAASPPQPIAPAAPPPSAIAQDVRDVLSLFLGYAKPDRAVAPIEERMPKPSARPQPPSPSEERVPKSASATPAAPPAAPPVESSTVLPAPRPDALPGAGAAPSAYATAPSASLPAYSTAPSSTPPARELAPRPLPPAAAMTAARRSDGIAAARAEVEVARVLWLAASASHPAQERVIADELRRDWPSNTVASAAGAAAGAARQFSDNARQAYMVRRDVQGALEWQVRAFDADSSDPEIAANLAFLYLKLGSPPAETARQIAMHGIGATPASLRSARADDWHTLAVASALTGREGDATNAFYVEIALTRNLDRSCKRAVAAVETYGDRLFAPVQAMMLRVRQRGREHESQSCTLPPRWQSSVRYSRGLP